MGLLDRMRKSLRITAVKVEDAEGRKPGDEGYEETYGSPFDDEIEMLMEAARRDLLRVGIREGLVRPEGREPDADIEQCITLYVKCHFGYDNNEAARFGESYRMAVCDLMNSPANAAAGEAAGEEGQGGGEPTDGPSEEGQGDGAHDGGDGQGGGGDDPLE